MSVDSLQQKMKDSGLRVTQARKDLLKLLEKSKRSLSAKEIYQKLPKSSSTDLVSIYRNLNLFFELGLAHRFQDGTYSVCHQKEESGQMHVHFINHCLSCGKKNEISSHDERICAIANDIKKVCTTLQTLQEIIIEGHCADCASSSAAT